MKQLVTRECISCGRKPVTYSGHVHKGQKIVLVGWCENCPAGRLARPKIRGCDKPNGCFGLYKSEYGIVEENI